MDKSRPSRWGLIKASYWTGSEAFLRLRSAVLIAILACVGGSITYDTLGEPHPEYQTLVGVADAFGYAVFLSPLAVLVHRRLILKEVDHGYFKAAFSPFGLRFLSASMLLALASSVDLGLGSLDRLSGWFVLPNFVVGVLMIVFMIRLRLVFPAIAVDGSKTPFADSLKITRGSGWWIAWTFVIAVGPIDLVAIALYAFAKPYRYGGVWMAAVLCRGVLIALFNTISVALLSNLYITRAKWAVDTSVPDLARDTTNTAALP